MSMDEVVRVRADEELKRALAEACQRANRTESKHTRHLLRLALGLPVGETDDEIKARLAKAKMPTPDTKKKAG